jgi:hypothetical protein
VSRRCRQLRRPTERVQALRRSQCTAGANIFLGGSLNRRYQNEKDFLSAEERHETQRLAGEGRPAGYILVLRY